MSIGELLTHRFLVAPRDPAISPDETGQLFVDSTGQTVGDTTIDVTDWSSGTPIAGRLREMTARWPEGPGAGAFLVKTTIRFPRGADIKELDKVKRVDVAPEQAYQITFVRDAFGRIASGRGHHTIAEARRIPL
jgi:hypothetical protein